MSILAYFVSLQEHLPIWRTEGFLILLMNSIYFHYITHTSPELGCLEEFKNQWQSHPLSSEGNCSPLQLHTSGMLENEQSSYAGVASVFDTDSAHEYGFDPSGPFPEEEDYQVVVPRISAHISSQQMAYLVSRCNTLKDEDGSRESTYLHCLNILVSMI